MHFEEVINAAEDILVTLVTANEMLEVTFPMHIFDVEINDGTYRIHGDDGQFVFIEDKAVCAFDGENYIFNSDDNSIIITVL